MALSSTPDLLSINSELGLSNQGLVECISEAGKTGTWDDQLDFAGYSHAQSIGGGLKFDGSNDYVNFYSPTALDNAGLENQYSPRTISLIFSVRNNSTRQEFVNFDSTSNNTERVIDIGLYNSSQLIYGHGDYYGGLQVFFNTTLTTNQVYHLIVNYSGGGMAGNINGYLNNSILSKTISRNTIGTISQGTQLRLGSYYNSSYFFQGTIWDFKIFDNTLNSSAMTELYTSKGTSIPSAYASNLIVDVRFDEGFGTTANDDSGNNIDGSLINFTNTTFGSSNAWVDENNNSRTS